MVTYGIIDSLERYQGLFSECLKWTSVKVSESADPRFQAKILLQANEIALKMREFQHQTCYSCLVKEGFALIIPKYKTEKRARNDTDNLYSANVRTVIESK